MAATVAVGAVYATSTGMRRIIAIHQKKVCYTKGGDRNFFCTPTTFRRWVRDRRATNIKEASE